jgi:hypothetical protein
VRDRREGASYVCGGGTGGGGAFACSNAFARICSISRASWRRSSRLAAFFFSERLHDTLMAPSRTQRAVRCTVLRGASLFSRDPPRVSASAGLPRMDDVVSAR